MRKEGFLNQIYLKKFFKTIFSKKQYLIKLNNKFLEQQKYNKMLNLQLFKKLQIQKTITEISYILDFSFSKKNIMLHVLDCFGSTKFFTSANLLNIKKKKNLLKFNVIIKKFYKILLAKSIMLKWSPIAIHLKNKNIYFKISWILKKLHTKFFIIILKCFYYHSFNGCRIKKLKRKKF